MILLVKDFIFIVFSKFGSFQPQKQPPEVFHKKDVLKNFAKLTGKHLLPPSF